MGLETSEGANFVDSFSYECQKQLRLKEQLESEGVTLAEDPSNLYSSIGTTLELNCYCELYTPRLLTKLYVEGSEHLPHSFHLVSLWQIVKYGYVIPQPGEYFVNRYVIGVRRILEQNSFIPSLRLPLN